MAIQKKNRSDLKSFFVKNAIPTEDNFADLIDGVLCQADDGVFKLPDDPLSIVAAGDAGGQKKVLHLYESSAADATPAWVVSLRPRADPNDASTASQGFSINDKDGNSRLCIDAGGRVGIGTTRPFARLGLASTGSQLSFRDTDQAVDNGGLWRIPVDAGALRFDVNTGVEGQEFGVNYRSPLTLHANGDASVGGALHVGGSDIYFTQTDHNHTALGNAQGHAAIENAANFDTLMILGRMTPTGRKVAIWDRLDVNGEAAITAGAVVNHIGIGTQVHGATSFPYETIQMNPGHNLRLWFGAQERFVFGNDGKLYGASLGPMPGMNRIACGSTAPGNTAWVVYSTEGIYVDVDTSSAGFTQTPWYFTSLGGASSHWLTRGVNAIYQPTATGFRVYVNFYAAITPAVANSNQWHIKWMGVGV
jgi:hypothetical protein